MPIRDNGITTEVDAFKIGPSDSAGLQISSTTITFPDGTSQTSGAGGSPLIYKGVIDCSSNPNYPAASAGHVYVVSVAGKIGGGSGTAVQAGDLAICNITAAAGTEAQVGTSWDVIQTKDAGIIRVGAGSASAPSISFLGDTNTGLISSASDAICVVTGGTEHWTFNASGALNPTTDSAKDIGNGSVNPRDIHASRRVITPSLQGAGLSLPHVVTKAASDTARNSHDAEATHTGDTTYTKVKTITLTNGLLGVARFVFDLKTSNVLNTANGRIYRNGVALGTEQSDVTGSYATSTEDLTQTWNPGDTAELWVKIDDAAQTVSVRNFRIAYDDAPIAAVASANS